MTNLLEWALDKKWAACLIGTGLLLIACKRDAAGDTLEVGTGKEFARMEDANAVAKAGDLILVYPREDGKPYEQTAVMIRQPGLTFRAVPAAEGDWVRVSGTGFEYSGRGQTPRAIFQFNRGSDGGVLEGFELSGAHNASHNGAGVRINQANRVTIRRCRIHHNDMGIMSNGDGTPAAGVNQLIERCRVHHNGALEDPGYNHNFYLGGTDVTLRFCEIYASLTGHNVKSRAHQTWVEYCYVHDSANREFDLVDAVDTARPDSDAVIMGCVIAKAPECAGNRGVVHFGQDGGGEHDGGLYLVHNSIIQPFISPLVTLSSRSARAQIVGNVVSDGGARQYNQRIVGTSGGAQLVAGDRPFQLVQWGLHRGGWGRAGSCNELLPTNAPRVSGSFRARFPAHGRMGPAGSSQLFGGGGDPTRPASGGLGAEFAALEPAVSASGVGPDPWGRSETNVGSNCNSPLSRFSNLQGARRLHLVATSD